MVEGNEIGAYRVLQRIGAGGMGEVWMAEHTVLGRRAAIKLLHPELSTRAEIVTRFFNEARAAAAISDPGIVQIFDFGHSIDGSAYIVMELLDGEPLDRRLGRLGTLPLRDALRLMRQVAASLGAAHARQIIHRDLKPENIFIVADAEVPGGERAKILDFGIAKLAVSPADAKTKTAAILGTPLYMSPEQCRGAGGVDQRADVYSLGCVLFMLVTGRTPFVADGPGEIIAMHLREPAPLASSVMPGIARAVDELIARCLAKNPDERFASAADLAVAIGRIPLTDVEASSVALPVTVLPTTPTTLSAVAGSREMVATRTWGRWAAGGFLAVVVAGGLAFGIVAAASSRHAPGPPAPARIPVAQQVAQFEVRADVPRDAAEKLEICVDALTDEFIEIAGWVRPSTVPSIARPAPPKKHVDQKRPTRVPVMSGSDGIPDIRVQ